MFYRLLVSSLLGLDLDRDIDGEGLGGQDLHIHSDLPPGLEVLLQLAQQLLIGLSAEGGHHNIHGSDASTAGQDGHRRHLVKGQCPLLVEGDVGSVGQALVGVQNSGAEGLISLCVAASGKGQRIGAGGHPHRSHRHGGDGPGRYVARRAGEQCLGRDVHFRLAGGDDPVLCGLKAHHIRRQTHGTLWDSAGSVRALGSKTDGAQRLGGLLAGKSPQLTVEIQIVALRRLGKGLAGDPLGLDVQGVNLGGHSVHPHRQVAPGFGLQTGLLLQAGEHLPENFINGFHVDPSLPGNVQGHRQGFSLPFQIDLQMSPAALQLSPLHIGDG